MPPKKAGGTVIPSSPARGANPSTKHHPSQSKTQTSQAISIERLQTATYDLWKSYWQNTPNSLLIIDAFLVFLMYVGAVQFVYACLTGGYPFNSFLAGFAAAVGQFVLAGTVPRIWN